ncbi:MAG: hypothetical protein EPO68_18365 [Planctomycetota bacterium]|nr:MAG: hypothetical protein EPO68_18365 [Planctomycetota bacterium]
MLLAALLALQSTESLSADWAAVAALPAGRERAARVALLLHDRARELSKPEIELAWRVGTEEADALRFDSAVPVQRALYERMPALWSVSNLALSLNRLEGAGSADKVLAEWLPRARGSERADVWSQRGTYWLGAGDAARGRPLLARAIALGSSDATVVLAREDLAAGRVAAARAGFAAALLERTPSPWAVRGFGVALLTP